MAATECGAASLAMVLAYYGSHVPLEALREACNVSRDGCNALDLVNGGNQFGLTTAAFKIGLRALGKVPTPAILHWDLCHFVVLESLDHRGANLVDPAVGRARITLEELSRHFTGIVLVPTPNAHFRAQAKSHRGLAKYRAALRVALRPLRMMLVSALVLELVALVQPAIAQLVVDFIIRPKQGRWLIPVCIAYASALLLRTLLVLARDRILSGLTARLDLELGMEFLRHLTSLPAPFFFQRGVGELTSRMQVLLGVRESMTTIALGAFDGLLTGAYGLLLVGSAPKLGALVVGFVAVRLAILTAFKPRIRAHATAASIASAWTESALVSAFDDPETQKAFGAQALLFGRYCAQRSAELNAIALGRRAVEASQQVIALLDGIGLALILVIGGRAVMQETMTIGVLSSFIAVEALLRRPSQSFANMFLEFGRLAPKLDRIDDVFDAPLEPRGLLAPPRLEGAITFENVSFRYGPNGPLILDGLSFRIAPGERVAIVGGSGSGKSTILKLILGTLRPTTGRIFLDGQDLAAYDPRAVRRRIGSVGAAGSFFEEPVLDNIAIGAPDADADAVRRAAEVAAVDDVIRALPRGYQTELYRGARHLSGGQRQRLLLARALAKRPDILLLDEASSALDLDLEATIQARLDTLRCTILLVAHRASALRLARRLLVLSSGKLVQEGTWDELTAQPGPTTELFPGANA
jgi:ATP-binding cassette subfamily B protein